MKVSKVHVTLKMNVEIAQYQHVTYEAGIEVQATRKTETATMLFATAWKYVEAEISKKVKKARAMREE